MEREKVWPELYEEELNELEERRKFLARYVHDANARRAKSMINSALKTHPLPIYNMKESVVRRLP